MPDSTQLATITRLLSHHLTSAIEIGSKLEQTALQAPDTGPGQHSYEINGRFEALRKEMALRRDYELLFLTNLARARYWFELMGRLDPAARKGLKAFLAATSDVDDALQALSRTDIHDPAGIDYSPLVQAASVHLALTRRTVQSRAASGDGSNNTRQVA